MGETLGILHFLEQSDMVARTVIAILASMSVASWYLILLKAWQFIAAHRRGQRFLRRFRFQGTLESAQQFVANEIPDEAFSRLACAVLRQIRLLPQAGRHPGTIGLEPENFLEEILAHAVAGESHRMEHGLSLLASVAATAPFIGLFGTVWGIYHALLSIGSTGLAGLDQIAGAVGEALIMTGCGLAVAVPAVLGHNGITRVVARQAHRLDCFAHQLFLLTTTGSLPCPQEPEPDEIRQAFAIVARGSQDGL